MDIGACVLQAHLRSRRVKSRLHSRVLDNQSAGQAVPLPRLRMTECLLHTEPGVIASLIPLRCAEEGSN